MPSPLSLKQLSAHIEQKCILTTLVELVNQFKPLRSQYKIIFLGGNSGLDSFTYPYLNDTVLHSAPGQLDGGIGLTGKAY